VAISVRAATNGAIIRAVRRSRSSGIFCQSWSWSWKTPAKTPADKIMKNYFIFQRTFGNGKIKLNDLKLL
jgi:hypothetical protein